MIRSLHPYAIEAVEWPAIRPNGEEDMIHSGEYQSNTHPACDSAFPPMAID
jgi:hypothetical protein